MHGDAWNRATRRQLVELHEKAPLSRFYWHQLGTGECSFVASVPRVPDTCDEHGLLLQRAQLKRITPEMRRKDGYRFLEQAWLRSQHKGGAMTFV